MSEAGERGRLDDPVVEGVLAAVDGPALVCDEAGEIRAWNRTLDEHTAADADLAGTAVTEYLEWIDDDAVDAALAGDDATAPARLAGDGRIYSVTARPLTREDVVGAVITLANDPVDDWPVYEGAVDASPDTLYVVDTNYRIRVVSDGFENLTKIPTAEVTGEPLSALVEYGVMTEETLERSRESLEAVFRGERSTVTRVSEPPIADGTVLESRTAPIDQEGDVVGAVTVVRDVTERERIAQARGRSQDRLQTILESLPVTMFAVDADGRIDHVQGFDFEAVPCDRSDLVGAPVDAFDDLYADLADGCRRALDGESWSTTAAVGDRTYEVVFEPVLEDGAVTGTIAVAVDVSDREERERELATTNERLDMALANTGAGVYDWYLDEDCVYWHSTTARLFGLDPATTHRPPSEFLAQVHPEDRDRVEAATEAAVETDGSLSVEYRVNDPGEDPRWFVSEGEVLYEDGEPVRLVGTVRDVTERKAREKELAERERRLRAVIESSADPIAMQDTDGRFRVVNEAMLAVAGSSRDELRGAAPCDVFDHETAQRLERHRRDVLATEGARVVEETISAGDEDRVVQLTVAPHYGTEGDVQGTVTIARDITELERQRDELETLTEIQGLVHESIGALTSVTTREGIKEAVCERLADSPFYEAAWIGSHDPSTNEIEPDYATDAAATYLESVTVATDPGGPGSGPGGTAYRTGEIQVVDDVAADPSFAPWADRAAAHGFGGVVATPLTRGATTHGLLVVYASDPHAFSEREVAGLEVLGETIGFALSAAQHRRLLESDRVLELEYTVEMNDSPFARASLEHDCRFVIGDAVHAGDGQVIEYLTVEGADPEVGERAAREHGDKLTSIRRLDDDEGPDFETKWRASVFQYVAEAGARGVRGVIEDGTGRLHVEAPGDVDIRNVTGAIETRFDGVEMTAKRERERPDDPWWNVQGDIDARLTDRQRSVLQAAYYSGYYEWPRDTDAETLADSLDVATPTFLQHLRKGHRRVLESMFDS